MHRVRLFVLWIMMVAVPFQGYAAVAMALCGPASAGGAAAVAAEPAEAHDPARHPHGDAPAEAGQGAHHCADKGPGADPDTVHKCSTCGACHGSAVIGSLQLAVFHDLPAADLAEPAIALATRVPRVLDKPPRA